MRCFLDDGPIAPACLVPSSATSSVPAHLRHVLRLELDRVELVALLTDLFAKLRKELGDDIARSGQSADEAEQAALDSPSIEAFLAGTPEHVTRIMRVYLWSDLMAALFDQNPESGWTFIADELVSVSVATSTSTFIATAFPVGAFAARDGEP
jgi:hypothetical protein